MGKYEGMGIVGTANALDDIDRRLQALEGDDEDKPTPVSEQVWTGVGEVGGNYYEIHAGELQIGIVFTPEMRDIIVGIPKLVKAVKRRMGRGHVRTTIGIHSDIYDALEAMGLGE